MQSAWWLFPLKYHKKKDFKDKIECKKYEAATIILKKLEVNN